MASPKTITSSVGFQDSQGNVLAGGALILDLIGPTSPVEIIGSGGQVAPVRVSITLDATGKIPGGTVLWANDQLQPAGTYYTVKVQNSNNLLVAGPTFWVVSGASPIDLSFIVPTTISPDPGFSNPVLQNPASPQTITGQSLTLASSTPFITSGVVTLNTTVSTYNSIPTVSNGMAAEYATVDLTGQTAPIAATTLYTPTATGLFRVLAYLKITTTGTSPVLGPVTITYTDGTDSVAQSVVMSQQLQTGATSNTGNNGNTTTSVLTGSLVIFAKTGVAIQYAVALTGTVGAAQYEAHFRLEAL